MFRFVLLKITRDDVIDVFEYQLIQFVVHLYSMM